MQCSFDLVTWTYFGEVIHSGFGIEKSPSIPPTITFFSVSLAPISPPTMPSMMTSTATASPMAIQSTKGSIRSPRRQEPFHRAKLKASCRGTHTPSKLRRSTEPTLALAPISLIETTASWETPPHRLIPSPFPLPRPPRSGPNHHHLHIGESRPTRHPHRPHPLHLHPGTRKLIQLDPWT